MTPQTQQNGNPILYIIMGMLAMGLVLGGIMLVQQLNGRNPEPTPVPATSDDDTMSGINIIDPPRVVPPFEMTAHTGDSFGLNDLQGQFTLLYFGYTHCPDACPTALLDFRRVKRDLGDDAQQVGFVLITVDPERDTPALLNRYLARYDESFIGLSGEYEVLDALIPHFNVTYERRENVGSEAGYMVDHTASKFLLDREGRLIRVYSFLTPPDVIVRDLRGLLG